MSSRAPSSRLAVLCSNCSPVTGCRLGSVPTPWHTSLSRFAVMLRISLCRIEGKPPLEQLSACSMVKCWPQTQWEGRYDSCHLYRKHRASLKAPLCRANSCSEMGKAESQLEMTLLHYVQQFTMPKQLGSNPSRRRKPVVVIVHPYFSRDPSGPNYEEH